MPQIRERERRRARQHKHRPKRSLADSFVVGKSVFTSKEHVSSKPKAMRKFLRFAHKFLEVSRDGGCDLVHICPVCAQSGTTTAHPMSRLALASPKAFRPETLPMPLSITVLLQCPKDTPQKRRRPETRLLPASPRHPLRSRNSICLALRSSCLALAKRPPREGDLWNLRPLSLF